jgi:hypothetical protein
VRALSLTFTGLPVLWIRIRIVCGFNQGNASTQLYIFSFCPKDTTLILQQFSDMVVIGKTISGVKNLP